MMEKHKLANLIILLLNLGALLTSLACPECPHPTPPPNCPPPKFPPKPPYVPKPPVVKPPPYVPKPPYVPVPKPPYVPKPPVVKPPTPYYPKPPVISPPILPPVYPSPPIVKPPPEEKPCPPPPPSFPYPPPPAKQTCPIDTLKLGACVDVLGGLVHIGIGTSAKDTCCPVLQGLLDLDAAICLCTTIKAKLLNINILLPIALQVLIDCGKTPPAGFQCPA
ncbi:36.4 kDa proline-rich protein-like [Durio zibethinus]|uniref:36.4 kDa proline-rich protein-like n=1 Tax=Durio zibethinus TaxID=66656 RepID=A0A6P5XIM2_DURZI|nr:36.4 kDa proline-rich protein-like [Durio zibethinus]